MFVVSMLDQWLSTEPSRLYHLYEALYGRSPHGPSMHGGLQRAWFVRNRLAAAFERGDFVVQSPDSATSSQSPQRLPTGAQAAQSALSANVLRGTSDSPQSLEDIELSERRKIRVVSVIQGVFMDLEWYMSEPSSINLPMPPEGFKVFFNNPEFSKSLKKKLTIAAAQLLRASSSKGPALPLHMSVTLRLDFTHKELSRSDKKLRGKGQLFYRFTHFAAPDGQPSMLVEELGPFDEAKASAERIEQGKQKFQDHGFKFDEQWMEKWAEYEKVRVLAEEAIYKAISLLPVQTLRLIPGILFTTEEVSQGAASYSYETHTLTIYRAAFSLGEIFYGAPTEGVHDNLTKTVAHELGHAIDLREPKACRDEERKIDSRLEGHKQNYESKERTYTSDRKQALEVINKLTGEAKSKKINALNRKTAEFNEMAKLYRDALATAATEKENLRKAKLSESGYRVYTDAKSRIDLLEVGGTTFLAAFHEDGGEPITIYAQESNKELFGDCYGLYVTDSARLKALRPSMFEYLDKSFGR